MQYTYDAWGKITSQTDSELTRLNPFRYRGYIYDEETGLYYLQSRYYDPTVGRFLNGDNVVAGVGSDQGYNVYIYCFNNPINMNDETGNWPRWITQSVAEVANKVSKVAGRMGAIGVSAAAKLVSVVAEKVLEVQTWHFDERRAKNGTVPEKYSEAMETPGADDSISAHCHQFTSPDKTNVKVCWKNGTEAIYNAKGDLVTASSDIGTYNYAVPDDFWGSIKHGYMDVLPWIVFGNYDDDTTTLPQRATVFVEGCIIDLMEG